jgi:hypothetical protein
VHNADNIGSVHIIFVLFNHGEEVSMPQARTMRHSFNIDDTQFQCALVLASMIALAIALVYFFPDKSWNEPWQPDFTNTPGP